MKKTALYLLLSSLILASDGDLDTTFAANGKLVNTTITLSPTNLVLTFIQSDGKILIGGTALNPAGPSSPTQGALVRYTQAGVIDTTFNAGSATPGTLLIDNGSTESFTLGRVIQQPDGKIVVAGLTTPDGLPSSFAITRFNLDGTPDTSFNGGAIQKAAFSGLATTVSDLAMDSNNNLIVAGTIFDDIDAGADIAVARYTPTGALDTTFNSTGTNTTPIMLGVNTINFENAEPSIAIDQNNNIVLAAIGAHIVGLNELANLFLARYLANGILDGSFTGGGATPAGVVADSLSFIPDVRPAISPLVIQPNGLYVIGYNIPNTNGPAGITTRYNTNGTIDTSFGTSGRTIPFITDGSANIFIDIALQSDGKIITAGEIVEGTNPTRVSFLLSRFTSNGTLDTTFGSPNGYVITSDFTTTKSRDASFDLAIQPNGFIVAVGVNATNGSEIFVAARYIVNNTPLDSTKIFFSNGTLSGTAQPQSVVAAFSGSTQLCTVQDPTGNWSCSTTIAGSGFTAVAHYRAGNVNILSTCTSTPPESTLTTAIRAKYCNC